MSQTREVLRIYRQILRLSRTWEPLSGSIEDTERERLYIKEESQRLFHKNKNITDADEVEQCIKEANSRIEMAHHYGTAYPRLMNVPMGAVAKSGTRQQKAQERLRHQAKPTYLHSHEEIDK